MSTQDKRGFTLIELLVVIAIIALLMSILMPALGQAREQARRVVCLTNLKNLGTAIESYGSSYKDVWVAGSDSMYYEYGMSYPSFLAQDGFISAPVYEEGEIPQNTGDSVPSGVGRSVLKCPESPPILAEGVSQGPVSPEGGGTQDLRHDRVRRRR